MYRKLAGLITVAVTGLFLTGVASAQIAGTAHDFSAAGWNGTGEICVVCHTPHDSLTGGVADEAPLWNHDITQQSFTMYSQTATDGTVAADLNAVSKLCLSCHDGVINVDSFGAARGTGAGDGTGSMTMAAINPLRVVDNDLSNDHPVSITYTDGMDPEMHDPTTTLPASLVGTISIDNALLFNASVECASCHDVHGTANTYLLRVANTGSNLCLTCHNK